MAKFKSKLKMNEFGTEYEDLEKSMNPEFITTPRKLRKKFREENEEYEKYVPEYEKEHLIVDEDSYMAFIRFLDENRLSYRDLNKYNDSLSYAFYGERDNIEKFQEFKLEGREFGRAYYNIPYPDFMSYKRINVTIKNIINSTQEEESNSIPSKYQEKPKTSAEFNDIIGTNLRTHIATKADRKKAYLVWDGGIVLSKSAAKKLNIDLGDKLLSRGGVKGVISAILEDDKMPLTDYFHEKKTCEMMIGQTKIDSKQAIIKEIQDTKGFTFVFKVPIFAKNESFHDVKPLSDNYLQVMASDETIFNASQFPRDYDYINKLFRCAYLKFSEDKLDVIDGNRTDIVLKLSKENKYLSWIPEDKRNLIKHYGSTPNKDDGNEFVYKDKKNVIKQWFKDISPMKDPSFDQIERHFRPHFEKDKWGYINYITNPVAMKFRAVLVPRDVSLNEIHMHPEHKQAKGENDPKKYTENETVIVYRDPITTKESIQFFKVKFSLDLSPYTIAINPQMMKPFNADCDGDCLNILKPTSTLTVDNNRYNDTKFNVFDGTFSPSKYEEIKDNLKSEHVTEAFFKDQIKIDKKRQSKLVEELGAKRKQVVAKTQHLGFGFVAPLLKIFDVETGMDKLSHKTDNIDEYMKMANIIVDLINGKPVSDKQINEVKIFFELDDKFINGIMGSSKDISPIGKYFLLKENEKLDALYSAYQARDKKSVYDLVFGGF